MKSENHLARVEVQITKFGADDGTGITLKDTTSQHQRQASVETTTVVDTYPKLSLVHGEGSLERQENS